MYIYRFIAHACYDKIFSVSSIELAAEFSEKEKVFAKNYTRKGIIINQQQHRDRQDTVLRGLP